MKKNPFKNSETIFDHIEKVAIERNRPELNETLSTFHKELIERCWSHDPKERPTFDEIIQLLKSDKEVNYTVEYQDYIKLTEKSKNNFNSSKEFHEFDGIIKNKLL